jgi:hypothetical protein
MAVRDIQEAERILAQLPEYGWLTSDSKSWWTVSEVAEHLEIGESAVRGWCEKGLIPGAVLHSRQLGWRIPRSGLMLYLADAQKR